ncbi:LysE family translocator [Agrobacterium radiobacter]|jgi:threonine/homoserine/homoserine lactone efflux protein|uniref:Threonine/homoserine/homoserine lactone efflux protein n=3 Tax=Agrobacterium tumefaciens complex TaxID=1183400 RepID=A0ABR6JAL8_AGRRD|nr:MULTISPECIES: LysE family translocator [Agrobacterium tumefaciens complex]TGE77569.1 LysE family translocator [Rhizobium sp. SEMIA 439]AYM08251.1 amino acid transporter [Agrobacterium tumefaciens]AYM84171.1 amino acid transporter [Agrobacterium tumefaciens]EHH06884.1 RhtB family transporter [Agrobacterium tumefaciens CCNWGS0286]KAA1233291.1 LysE family translocator [Agrobacterium tumefaciens]
MIASQIALVYGTYIVATASPGPSNMAIMGTAMRDGRLPALALTAGVITGSLFWAILAATGMSAALAAYAQALFVIKIFGGVYLLYLAFRAGRSALKPVSDFVSVDTGRATPRYRALYRQGLLMHIGNPKAIMAWIAIMSLGFREDAPAGMLPAIIGGCAILGVIVFGSYALLFSTASMIALYTRLRRWIESVLSVVFAAAGLKLLLWQN